MEVHCIGSLLYVYYREIPSIRRQACVAADSFSFSGDAEIEKRASEGARLG